MKTRNNTSGFTLAELLVASVLLSITLGAVYMAFSSSIRIWRIGEAGMQAHQEARLALHLLSRELQNQLPGTEFLFEGTDDELAFVCLTQPLSNEDREGRRILWVRYRVRSDPNGKGKILLREERSIESELPVQLPGEEPPLFDALDLGRRSVFELARGVDEFHLEYLWARKKRETGSFFDDGGAQIESTELIAVDESKPGDGLPQGMNILLTLIDATDDDGLVSYTNTIAFRGPTTALEEESPLLEETP